MTKTFEEKDWTQVSDGFKFEIDIKEHQGKSIIQTYQTEGNTAREVMGDVVIIDNVVRLEMNKPINGYVVIIFDK